MAALLHATRMHGKRWLFILPGWRTATPVAVRAHSMLLVLAWKKAPPALARDALVHRQLGWWPALDWQYEQPLLQKIQPCY